MIPSNKIKVALVDDHVLLRKGLAALVNSFDDFTVVFEADNGQDMQQKIKTDNLPDLVLLDINMPKMDGYASAQWLKQTYPLVKIMALSMYDNENAVIRMFKAGARGYILKDCEPPELKTALLSVIEKGYFYSELVTGKLIHSINKLEEDADIRNIVQLNDKEIQFLKLACTELTYKEIAEQMYLSPRTIDGYRDALFEKLQIKTRVGLVMYAIKNGFVQV
ncbi:MAG: response regulator transcription factor [Chitinophagaceae bacterium]|jgi:DNA-binding NarL/FixJ family response regulator|nr:MAG: DNA-binding response regulator [Sphingobacteriales bacterium 44-61]TXJ25912.1 MAG: response regulator transcription factor [Chitinophagaceae bacterium]